MESHGRTLGCSLAVAAGFILLVAYIFLERAGLLYYLWVAPIAYLATFVVLVIFFAESDRRLLLLSLAVLGTLAIVATTAAVTRSHGYPISYQGLATSCSTVKVPNATSPWGYTDSGQCSTTPTANAASFLWNFLYWLPVSGLALFTLPTWREEKAASEKAGYAILGLVLLAALLLPLVGIPSVGL
jgi:hypothetical protein